MRFFIALQFLTIIPVRIKKQFGEKAKIIYLTAPIETRFERAKERARPGDPQTLAEFKKQQEFERQRFGLAGIEKFADFVISNEGTIEELYKKIDDFVKKLKNQKGKLIFKATFSLLMYGAIG